MMPVEESASIEDLIRTVVERTGERNGHSELADEDSHAEEVIIDIQVDGMRYLVIRLPKPNQREVQLSPREQEIVRLVAEGHPNKIIADVLSISSWTVCTHLRRIFSKLGVSSRAAMVARISGQGRSSAASTSVNGLPSVDEPGARREPQRARAVRSTR